MSETEKPFACSSTGCNMRFAGEEQLTVHKKKHDMMLNLGNSSKNAGFVADQTPTPTRFIRNCEEVGLFQDLQNVNPFEETFRRAVESGNTGTLTVPEAGITDDTLHTPHIFPHIADVLTGAVQECSAGIAIPEKTDGAEEPRTLEVESDVCANVKLSAIKDVKLTEKDETLTRGMIDRSTGPAGASAKILAEQPSPQLSINGEEVQLLLKTADGKLMQLSAMPVCEDEEEEEEEEQDEEAMDQQGEEEQAAGGQVGQIDGPRSQTVVIKTEPALRCATKTDSKKASSVTRLCLAKMRLKQALTKSVSGQAERGVVGTAIDSTARQESRELPKKEGRSKMMDQMKKKEILERNRASSMRARAKRKAWIQQLERTVANVNETNVALQMEVKVLRNEVAKLKTLLLAHKDCPVTKAMQKGNGIVLGPKIISVNPADVLTSPVPLTGATSAKRASAEVSIVPKKKLSFAASKNPPIFPKVECTANVQIPSATLIKTVPTLKIMGLGQLLAEKEETKQILIVQNPPRKIGESSPRQVIQINPNYEVEHAASKSTGT